MNNKLLEKKRQYINLLKKLFFEGKICIELLEVLLNDELREP